MTRRCRPRFSCMPPRAARDAPAPTLLIEPASPSAVVVARDAEEARRLRPHLARPRPVPRFRQLAPLRHQARLSRARPPPSRRWTHRWMRRRGRPVGASFSSGSHGEQQKEHEAGGQVHPNRRRVFHALPFEITARQAPRLERERAEAPPDSRVEVKEIAGGVGEQPAERQNTHIGLSGRTRCKRGPRAQHHNSCIRPPSSRAEAYSCCRAKATPLPRADYVH